MQKKSDLLVKIHEALFRIRTEAGVTQEELADRLDISRNTVRAYETGAVKPSLEVSLAWCDACGYPSGAYVDEVTGRRPSGSGLTVREKLHRYIDLMTDSDLDAIMEAVKILEGKRPGGSNG